MAAQCPTVIGKIGAIAGGFTVGGLAIASKNIIEKNTNPSQFKESALSSSKKFNVLFERSEDSFSDLLYVIGSFESLELIFSLVIGFYFLLIYLRPAFGRYNI